MTEVLVHYDDDVQGPDERTYRARAIAQERESGLWDGWLEFETAAQTVNTGRETTQPNRDAVFYWATGLTHTYLEGALERALSPSTHHHIPDWGASHQRTAAADHTAVRTAAVRSPVLDPFAVYAEGAGLLHDQLGALSADQLRTIIMAYRLSDDATSELHAMAEWELRAVIIRAVERTQR